MLKSGNIEPQGLGAFSIFAGLAALTLLMSANLVSPGCTGPEVKRCDYVATAKAAMASSDSFEAIFHGFSSDRILPMYKPFEDQVHYVAISDADADIHMSCGGICLVARITKASAQRLGLAIGRDVFAVIKSVQFERQNGVASKA